MKALRKSVLKKSKLAKLAAGTAVSAVMAISAPAFADPANDYRRSGYDLGRIVVDVDNRDYRCDNFRRDNFRRDNFRRDNFRGDNFRNRHTGPITVRLNFDANGRGRVPLQRLLRNQHGINSSDWRIRSVNVRHKSSRFATAALRIGNQSSGRVSLRKGITTIYAPRGNRDGYNSGSWVLGYNNAKLRDLAVVLEPVRNKRHGHRSNRRNGSRDLAFNARVR